MHTLVNLHQLVQSAGDAIVVSDVNEKILLWNPAAERIFGFSENEVLGSTLDVIVPERQRQRHQDGYKKTMVTGLTRYGNDVLRVPARHKDGRSLSIAFTVALLLSDEGKPTAIVAIIRDETSRFNEDRNLRKRLAELEARLSQG